MNRGKNQRGWIGLVCSHQIFANMSASRLENSEISTNVGTWDSTRTTHKRSTNIGKNVSVQVTANNNIKLLWFGYKLSLATSYLHTRIVNNHIFRLDPKRFITLSNFTTSIQKQTITQFPTLETRYMILAL
jgi:hypothetical protein